MTVQCTICNSSFDKEEVSSVLMIGRTGRAYKICQACECLMDAVVSDNDFVSKNAKKELYHKIASNESVQHNIELLDYFSQIFQEKDIDATESEVVDDVVSDKESLPQNEQPRLFEFKNGFTKSAIDHIRKRHLFSFLPGGIIISLLFAIPITVWMISAFSGTLRIVSLIVLWTLFSFLPFLIAMPPSEKQRALFCPSLLFIEGEYIVAKSDAFYQERCLNDVETVMDFGEYYQLVFNRRRRSAAFLCAKNGITIGDLEQFENLFIGKITRKSCN